MVYMVTKVVIMIIIGKQTYNLLLLHCSCVWFSTHDSDRSSLTYQDCHQILILALYLLYNIHPD